MSMQAILRSFALLAVLAIIVAAIYLILKPGDESPAIGENEQELIAEQTYENATLGISFVYPQEYELAERDLGTGERSHHVITLTHTSATTTAVENGEGPPSITLDIFEDTIDALSIERWIKNTAASNFKLSVDGVLSTTTVAGKLGLTYTWDGLYRGETTVIEHGGNVLMFSVSFIDSADTIRDDFQALLESVHLDEPLSTDALAKWQG